METSAHISGFGPRHPSLRAASRSSPEDDHSPIGFPTYTSITSPLPLAQTMPRGEFDQPGPSAYLRDPPPPIPPPGVDLEAQVRDHHTRRSRAISTVEEVNQNGDDSGPLSQTVSRPSTSLASEMWTVHEWCMP